MRQQKYRFAPALSAWKFLLHGLDKYAERSGDLDFTREVEVNNPISYPYSMSEPNFESDLSDALDGSLSSFPEVKSLKPEQRLVMEKVVYGRDLFA